MSRKKKQERLLTEEKRFFEKLEKKYQYIIAVAVILIPLIYSFSPYLFENLRPTGTDVVASKGETNLYKQWQDETGEKALWNPNIFCGMPAYPRITPMIFHVDSFIRLLDSFAYWAFFYFVVGALGIFFLLLYKKIPWQFAVVVAVAFSFLPDWQALVGDGHYTKLRAIMVLPWLILSFNYFVDKNNWFGAAMFAFIFSWMFRTQHFQIVFYGILILFFLFVVPVIKIFIEKKFKEGTGFVLKLAAAIVLTVMTSAQPFLSIREYAPYSTRGGNPVELGDGQQSARTAGGVSLDYATQWSLAPSEMMDFFIQRFHGGISGETYDGDKYPQLKDQQVPGYWGQKPFSGNYHYLGMILFLFALLGLIKYRHDKFVLALGVFAAFSLLLSFGRHFIELYEIFYYYVPYFSKFRAPSMMANITFIAILILSGYGLKSITEIKHPDDTKLLIGIFGGAVVFAAAVLLMKDSFTYLGANEAGRYEPQTLDLLKDIRKEFLTTDTTRLLIMLVFTAAATLAYYFKKLKNDAFAIVILVLVAAELFPANKRAFDKIDLNNEREVEASVFSANEFTKFLSSKSKQDRLLVTGREFQSNHYAYFHPTINGYSAIKMQAIQDINEHNLFNSPDPERLNWNVINMLSGKYILSDGRIDREFLSPVAFSQQSKQILFVNNNSLPKAWLVKKIKYFDSPSALVRYMNDTSFSPSAEALLVNSGAEDQGEFSAEGSIEVTEYTPNIIKLNYDSDSPQFIVLSEPYYPEGWKAIFMDKELPIKKVNHILRGIELPAGSSEVVIKFEPQTYFTAVTLSWIGNIIILLLLGRFGYLTFSKKR